MKKLSCLIATLSVLILGLAPAVRAQDVPSPFDLAFNPAQLLTLHLEMASGDWSKVASDRTNSIYKPALFWAEEDAKDASGNPIKLQVAVRRKSSRDLGTKVAIKIDINQIVDGQKWRNLNKLSLENGADNGVVEEGLAWQLHRMASYAATGGTFTSAYAAWVKLYVNGQYLGVYASVEQRDKQMLRNRGLWTKGETWIYEQDDVSTAVASEGVGDSPAFQTLCFSPFIGASTGKTGRKSAAPPCPTPGDADLTAMLDGRINMDAMLAQAAVDAYLGNNDALFTHGKNFAFVDFSDPKSTGKDIRRLYFPWDLDTGFKSTSGSIYSQNTQTAYQNIILNHPAYRARYNAIMQSLIDGPLSGASLNSFLDQIEATLTVALASDPNLSSDWAGFGKLRSWVYAREANVRLQIGLNGPPSPR